MSTPEFPEVPKIQEMQKAISRLRMLLALLKGKEEALDALVRQFNLQLERAPRHAIHGGNPLDNTLSIMGEIQERLDGAEKARSHLDLIKRQAVNELEALNITCRINEAKEELANLTAEREDGHDVESGRIEELQRIIEEASNRAAKAITGDIELPRL